MMNERYTANQACVISKELRHYPASQMKVVRAKSIVLPSRRKITRFWRARFPESKIRERVPGVVTGLLDSCRREILFIETSLSKGKGNSPSLEISVR